jgi:hypothetical protein
MVDSSSDLSSFSGGPNTPSTPRKGGILNLNMSLFPKLDNDILVTKEEMEFWVVNPEDVAGHIEYEVRGLDSKGVWEGKRRFSEFFMLREALRHRWSAIPIPFLPEKKYFGNKELNFL